MLPGGSRKAYCSRGLAHPSGVPASVGARVHLTYYPAGHMMYVNPESIAKMKRDLDGFIDSTARQ